MELKSFKTTGWTLISIGLVGAVFVVFFWSPMENWSKTLPSGMLSIMSVLAAVGTTLLSIFYSSGEWYEVYIKFKNLGIHDAQSNRKGREMSETDEWLKEIERARISIILSGVTLGGWFITAWNDLSVKLPKILDQLDLFEIFLLHPLSEGFKMRDKDEKESDEVQLVGERVIMVLKI